MCKLISGVILKNKIVLAPIYNQSHSALLKKLNIEDNRMNASKTFVRVELSPVNSFTEDVKNWKYKVDQDIVPDWYENDPGRYEEEYRAEVATWVKENVVNMCGRAWTAFNEDEKGTYYLMLDKYKSMIFGKDNNYAVSYVREDLNNSDLLVDMKREYGNRLVPTTINLLSLDGLDDYGVVEGDLLGIQTLDMFRKNRKRIPNVDYTTFTATPDSTPSGYGSGNVRVVHSSGFVNCDWYDCGRDVHPFCILKS